MVCLYIGDTPGLDHSITQASHRPTQLPHLAPPFRPLAGGPHLWKPVTYL